MNSAENIHTHYIHTHVHIILNVYPKSKTLPFFYLKLSALTIRILLVLILDVRTVVLHVRNTVTIIIVVTRVPYAILVHVQLVTVGHRHAVVDTVLDTVPGNIIKDMYNVTRL